MGASWERHPLSLELALEQVGPQADEVALGLGTEGGPEIGQGRVSHGEPPE
ncbi:MAG: hypothetical protein M3R02_07175 [Chloroflexota bacterium]|nr:hypothetical protein [Chloroflexota bacterium]